MTIGEGILLSDDLIFTSRITGTASHFGGRMRVARTPAALITLAEQQPPACVILDLGHDSLDISTVVIALRALSDPSPQVIAYGSHVAVDVLRAAREAGCDRVMPRSQFVEQLPTAMRDWLGFQA